MVYGHAQHFSVPWETLIKTFREELANKCFPTTAEYLDAFKAYLSAPRFVTPEAQELSVLLGCTSAFGTLNSHIARGRKKFVSKDINAALDTMEKYLQDVHTPLSEFTAFEYKQFAKKYASVLDAFLDDEEYFDADLPKSCQRRFKEIVFQSLSCSLSTSFMSGLVVAGFGDGDMFPSLHELKVDGGFFDNVRIIETRSVDMKGDEKVSVDAFAQEDVVDAFMKGYDADYETFAISTVLHFMELYTSELLDRHTMYTADEKKVVKRAMEPILKDSLSGIQDALREFSADTFSNPVKDMLRAAPKDEIAHVAEALVSLTSLKRRVTPVRETVGGPIDVAVISKGDGFVWVKRKHYFDPEFNHQFLKNYFRGMERPNG